MTNTRIVLVRQLNKTLNIYTGSSDEITILDLVETVDGDADIKEDGCRYYIQQILRSEDMTFDARMANKLMESGEKVLKNQQIGELEAEYDDLSSKITNLEEQIDENLRKQKKLM